MARDPVDRLFERVSYNRNGCWEWIGPRVHGYGLMYMYVKGRKLTMSAHRLSWEYFNAEQIPNGLQIDHLCRNRACVNPAHLEVVTCRENVLRGTAPSAENSKKTQCPAGHPYNTHNLYVYGNKRYCRTCRAARKRQENIKYREKRLSLSHGRLSRYC